jgi:hypothetical protein
MSAEISHPLFPQADIAISKLHFETIKNTGAEHPTPPQAEIAINRMEKKHPEAADRQKILINKINEQLFNNTTTYKTEDGTVFPYTTISFTFTPERQGSSFLGRIKKKEQKEKEHSEIGSQSNIIEFVQFGYSMVKNEGYPQQRPDALYDRVFHYMGEAKKMGKPLNVTIVSLGQATGLGGKYTDEFYQEGKEHGFKAEAKHIAALAETFIPTDPKKLADTRFNFWGLSMGALKAGRTAIEFADAHPEIPANKYIHADMVVPPRSPGLSEEYQPKGGQIIYGFGKEGIARRQIVDMAERVMSPTYQPTVEKYFEEKGIDVFDSKKQLRLKRKAVLYLNVKNILTDDLYKRSGHDFPFPVHVIRASNDFINKTRAIERDDHYDENAIRIVKEGNVTTEFRKGHHSINFYRVDTWARNMDGVDFESLKLQN